MSQTKAWLVPCLRAMQDKAKRLLFFSPSSVGVGDRCVVASPSLKQLSDVVCDFGMVLIDLECLFQCC